MLNPNNFFFFFEGGELSRRTNRQYQFNVYLHSVSLGQIRISLEISIALKKFAQRSGEGSSPSSLRSFRKKTLESPDFNLLQDESFRGCSRMGGAKRPPLSKICHTHPTRMLLGTVIPSLKKIQKIHKSRGTPLEFY